MKHLFLALALAVSTLCMSQQQVVLNGTTFSVEQTTKQPDEQTEFTWKDNKGIEYPIFISSRGSCYIKKVSQKSNKEYKQYLPKEVSMQICKLLKREYKSK